jgi:hypothetical protein
MSPNPAPPMEQRGHHHRVRGASTAMANAVVGTALLLYQQRGHHHRVRGASAAMANAVVGTALLLLRVGQRAARAFRPTVPARRGASRMYTPHMSEELTAGREDVLCR